MVSLIFKPKIYRLRAVNLLIPDPLSRQWIAVAHANHHRFVLLVAVLRVLVGGDVKKSCNTTKGEAIRSGGLMDNCFDCPYDTRKESMKSDHLI